MKKGEYYEKALNCVGGDAPLLGDVHDLLLKYGLTEEAYAQVFAMLFHTSKEKPQQLTYVAKEKAWMQNGVVLSDLKLFAAVARCCDLIRAYVFSSWENCILSAWVESKELKKIEAFMDSMESLTRVRNLLELASAKMAAEEGDSKIAWGTEDPADAG